MTNGGQLLAQFAAAMLSMAPGCSKNYSKRRALSINYSKRRALSIPLPLYLIVVGG